MNRKISVVLGVVCVLSMSMQGDCAKSVSPTPESTSISGAVEKLPKYVARVSEVYSANNLIKGCYYTPKLSELSGLQTRVESKSNLAKAYMGFYDKDNKGPYKPKGKASRELEILGYDLLLEEESYSKGKYSVKLAAKTPSRGTVIMDIYKALGREKLKYEIDTHAGDITLADSPASLELPGIVEDLNKTVAVTDVFVTRTVLHEYVTQAQRDLNISTEDIDERMSANEFIVLLAKMMEFYGEPVMTTNEMHELLQVYGAEIPSELTPKEKDAYLYLRARGVLNIELAYAKPIELNDMLNVLMCVKDEDSRTNYKQIKVTKDIGDKLKKAGYFPKRVKINEGDKAIMIAATYDYSTANMYDYYIRIGKYVNKGDRMYVKSVAGDINSTEMEGVLDYGKVGSYYRLSVPMGLRDETLMLANVDKRVSIRLEPGGGIYEVIDAEEGVEGDSVLQTERQAFAPGEYESSVDKERFTRAQPKVSIVSLINRITCNMSMHVLAARNPSDEYFRKGNKQMVTLVISNVGKGATCDENKKTYPQGTFKIKKDSSKKEWIVTLPAVYEQYFRSTIKGQAAQGVTEFDALATIEGNTMVSFEEAVKTGLIYKEGKTIPEPLDSEGQVLEIKTKYGSVRLNNKEHEIVVGNTLYKLKTSKPLFEYTVKNGVNELYIDFRAVYGWTDNKAECTVTGTGDTTTINLKLRGKSSIGNLSRWKITQFDAFKTEANEENVTVLPKGIDGNKSTQMLLSTQYTLANYMLYSGVDETSGKSTDRVYVFYQKEAVGKGFKDESKKFQKATRYKLKTDDWVCKEFKLSRNSSSEKSGTFSYTKSYGYVYNVPKQADFTLKQYVKGTLAIPICEASNEVLLDANVNAFTGVPYGYRPGSANHICGYKDRDVKEHKDAASSNVKSAPVGIMMGLANTPISARSASSDKFRDNKYDVYYYGTTPITRERVGEKNVYKMRFYTPVGQKFEKEMDLEDCEFYLMKTEKIGTKLDATKQYWVAIGQSLLVEEVPEKIEKIDVVDGENKDKYSKYDELSFKYLIERTDGLLTIIIYFTFKVLPYVGICLVTILLGMALVSEMRVVRVLCHKLIDPVKLITFGRISIDELTFRNAFLSLMILYILCALVLDCNFIRVWQWALEAYVGIVDMLRN